MRRSSDLYDGTKRRGMAMAKENAKSPGSAFVWAAVFLIVSFFILYAGVAGLRDGREEAQLISESVNWPTTEGVIAESSAKYYSSDYDDGYSITFRYDYEVDGRTYTGHDIGLGFSGASKSDVDRHSVGEPVTVYYQPGHPETAFIDPERHADQPSVGGPLFFVIFAGIFGFAGLVILRQSISTWERDI